MVNIMKEEYFLKKFLQILAKSNFSGYELVSIIKILSVCLLNLWKYR